MNTFLNIFLSEIQSKTYGLNHFVLIFLRQFSIFIFSVSKTKGIIAMKNYKQETCMTAIYYFHMPLLATTMSQSFLIAFAVNFIHQFFYFFLLRLSLPYQIHPFCFSIPFGFVHLKRTDIYD